MMEGKIMDKIMKIPTNEILAITEAEIYKLPFSKRIRLVKAFIVQEYPFAKFLVSLFMRTNPREEEDDKEPVCLLLLITSLPPFPRSKLIVFPCQ
jgi:hypothetical protein